MKNKIMKHKKILSTVLLTVAFLFLFSNGDIVNAEDAEGGSLNKDGNANYTVDTVPDAAVEDEGWLSKIGGAIVDGVKWGVSKIPLMGWIDDVPNMSEVLPTVLNFFVDVIFKLNIQLTHALIFILELAFDFNVVNILLEEVEGSVQDISGIGADGLIQSTGMFGTFGLIIVIITVIYAVFIVLFKRSMLESFSVMLQTVFVITLAILLFTNFSFYMTGANTLTTQASSLILGGNSVSYDITKDSDDQSEDAQNLKDGMSDNIWKMFVDRPFLYMMFGEINYSRLHIYKNDNGMLVRGDDANEGRKRVERVVFLDGEDRYEALINDMKTYHNPKPLHSSVGERIAFTPLYFGINAMVSIPILLLCLAMILFQFWFLIIAVFAPFVFIIAAIPGQIGVLKQYGKELMLPLLLKMALSFFMLIFFVFSDVLYNLNEKVSSLVGSSDTVNAILMARPDIYLVLVGVLNLVVFASVLLLSRRIFGIFSASPLGKAAISPINSGIQSTASLVGAGVGAITGGPGGALAGASLGDSVGKMATGEGSAGDVATSAMRVGYMKNLSSLKKDGGAGDALSDADLTDDTGNKANDTSTTDNVESLNDENVDAEKGTTQANMDGSDDNQDENEGDNQTTGQSSNLDKQQESTENHDEQNPIIHSEEKEDEKKDETNYGEDDSRQQIKEFKANENDETSNQEETNDLSSLEQSMPSLDREQGDIEPLDFTDEDNTSNYQDQVDANFDSLDNTRSSKKDLNDLNDEGNRE